MIHLNLLYRIADSVYLTLDCADAQSDLELHLPHMSVNLISRDASHLCSCYPMCDSCCEQVLVSVAWVLITHSRNLTLEIHGQLYYRKDIFTLTFQR